MGNHIADDARLFHHVAGVKVTGLGLHTLENRAPKRCNIKHPSNNQLIDAADPFVNGVDHTGGFNYLFPTGPSTYESVNPGATCECNPKVWSDAGYTPTDLYRFYRYVEDAIDEGFGHYRSKIFMLIQEGFPQVGDFGGYEGDTLAEYDFITETIMQSSVPGVDYPQPTEQTEELLRQGREGLWWVPESGGFPSRERGRTFIASHQALNVLPQDAGLLACNQQEAIDTTPGTNLGSPLFPVGTRAHGGPHCPNKWAANEGIVHGQNTGFQTTNSIVSAEDVDSTLWNLTANTNGTYYENYERTFWLLANEVTPGTGPSRVPLDATPTLPGAVAKNLNAWGEVLRWRRRQLDELIPGNLYLNDPYPDIWKRTFSKDIPNGDVEYYYYINPRVCSGATPDRYMVIEYIGT